MAIFDAGLDSCPVRFISFERGPKAIAVVASTGCTFAGRANGGDGNPLPAGWQQGTGNSDGPAAGG